MTQTHTFNVKSIILSAVVMGMLLSMMSPLAANAQALPEEGNSGLDRGVASSQNTTMLAQIEMLRELIAQLQVLVEQKRALGEATATDAQNRVPAIPTGANEAQGMADQYTDGVVPDTSSYVPETGTDEESENTINSSTADQYRPAGDVRGAHTSREEAIQKINELRSQIETLQAMMPENAGKPAEAGAGAAPSFENGLPVLPEQASDRAKQVMQCLQLGRSLGLGAQGADVQQIQEFLKEKGFFTFPTATGYYGPVTQEAIEAFQASQGIVSNGSPETTGFGLVGPRTQAALAQASCLSDGQTPGAEAEENEDIEEEEVEETEEEVEEEETDDEVEDESSETEETEEV